MTVNILAVAASAVTFAFVFFLLRRGSLREKYAVLWLFFSGVALFFAIFPGAPLAWLSQILGVIQPVNLLFFITFVILVLVNVQLSYELSRHEMRIRRLAEEAALLRYEINQKRQACDDD
jgi:hypothetical protein